MFLLKKSICNAVPNLIFDSLKRKDLSLEGIFEIVAYMMHHVFAMRSFRERECLRITFRLIDVCFAVLSGSLLLMI